VPGSKHRAIQFIDVRDLSEWIIRMAELKKTGVYNATGPQEKFTMQTFIEACSPEEDYIWMEDEFLVEHRVEAFTELPLWIPENDEMWAGFLQVNTAKALQDGLSFRPLSETIQDTLDWFQLREAPFTKGLNPEKEKQLIEVYRQQ
jgi:2'-hydroxyisoflavone reductase